MLRRHPGSGWVLARLLAPAASIAVALAAIELVLRLTGYGAPVGRAHAGLLRYEPTLGWEKAPGKTVVYSWRGRYVRESSNEQGFRGPVVLPGKKWDEFRLLLLGDSFCEGFLVNEDEVVSAVLPGLWPASRSETLSIINAGVAGYSTDQQLLLFRRIGAEYAPDLTVLFFFDNDVWFNTASTEYRSAKPLFVLENGALRLTGVPVPEPPTDVSADPLPQAQPLAWLDGHSYLYRLIEDRVRRTPALSAWAMRLGWLESLDSESGPARPDSAPIPREFLVYARRPSSEKEAAWDLTKALLRELKRDTEKAGSELAVFYVPASPAVYDGVWRATQTLYGLRDDEWDIRQPEGDLARICEDLGIAFLATTDRFRSEAARLSEEGKDLYFKDEGHWNGEGHRFAALLLHEFLAARPATHTAP